MGQGVRKERTPKGGTMFSSVSGDRIWWRFEGGGIFPYHPRRNAKVLGMFKTEER